MSGAARDRFGAPAPEVVRAYARDLVRRIARACRRLDAAADAEALHDFRVGLRRLRSHLRAYRQLHRAGRKAERRLRSLARRTNRARDAEVALAWLEARSAGTEADPAVAALAARLAAERDAAGAGAGRKAADTWRPLARDLKGRLARPAGSGEAATFAVAAAAAVGAQADRLQARLGAVREITDEAPAHRARIAAKRLRYLLEPLKGAVTGADAAVAALTSLQDTLGTMRDLEVVIAYLGEALQREALEGADLRLAAAVAGAPPVPEADAGAGLLALAARAAAERNARFEELRKAVLADGGADLLDPVREICAALTGRGA